MVTKLAYLCEDPAQLDLAFIPGDPRAMRGVVECNIFHAGQLLEMPFVEPDTGRAGDTFEYQRCLADIVIAFEDEALLHFRMIIEGQLAQFTRHQLIRSPGKLSAVTVVIFKAIVDDGFGYRLAAMTAQAARFVENTGCECAACRDR
jgi:hypothetical protein